MKRVWSLLTPGATGRRRGRGLLVLALAIAVPAAVLVTLVPQRGADAVPVALVNLDTPIQQDVDGTDVPVAAGKLLTENLVNDAQGIEWTLTDSDTARAGLDSGAFLAVVTVPSDFSEDAATLTGGAPTQATIAVQTSTAHGYLVSAVADALTANLPAGVSTQLTEQYVGGTLGALGELRTGIGQAGDAASEIAAATDQAAEGARQIAAASDQLTGGLEQMTGVLRALPGGAHDLGALTAAGATQSAALSLGLAGASLGAEVAHEAQLASLATIEALQTCVGDGSAAPTCDVTAALADLNAQAVAVEELLAGQSGALAVGAADAGALAIGAGTIAAVSGPVADGLGQLAEAAAGAAGGSAQLAAAEAELAGGLDRLAEGTDQLGGALSEVSTSIPDHSADEQKQIASVVASPIAVERTAVSGPGSAWLSAIAVVAPVGLWLGAFVLFLVLAPFARNALTTPASAGRIAADGAGVAIIVALAQGVIVWGVLALVGAAPDRLPVALALVLASSVCFALVHQMLVAAFGRAGLIVSAVLLGLQLVAAGTLSPAALAPAADSPLSLLPLSLGLQGAQALVGGSAEAVVSAAVGLGIWAVAAWLGTVVAITAQRRRTMHALIAG